MFVFTAIDLNDQLRYLKPFIKSATDRLGYVNKAESLPFHVSLRISFQIDDKLCERAVRRIEEYLNSSEPFEFKPLAVEANRNILWIKMEKNENLTKLHNGLIDMLHSEFGIQETEYDRNFIFHSTLFFGDEAADADNLLEAVCRLPLPKSLKAESFMMGISETGEPGDYRIIRG